MAVASAVFSGGSRNVAPLGRRGRVRAVSREASIPGIWVALSQS
jgi:hypothetical protein